MSPRVRARARLFLGMALLCLAAAAAHARPAPARPAKKKTVKQPFMFTKEERVTISKALARFLKISCYFGDKKSCALKSEPAPAWLAQALPALSDHDCFDGNSNEADAWIRFVRTTQSFLNSTEAPFPRPMGADMPLQDIAPRYRQARDDLSHDIDTLRRYGFEGSLQGRGARIIGRYELILDSMSEALEALEKKDWKRYREAVLSVAWQADDLEALLRAPARDLDTAAPPVCRSLEDALAASSGTLADETRFFAMGNNFFRVGSYEKAQRAVQRFLEIAAARRDAAGLQNGYAGLAIIEIKLDEQDAMRRDMALALETAEQRNDLYGERSLLTLFGGWLKTVGRADDLQADYASRGAALDDQLQGAQEGLERGQKEFAAGRYAQAKQAFLQSAGLGSALSYLNIGACDIKLGNPTAAISDFEQALEDARAQNRKNHEALALLGLSDLYAAQGDTADSIEAGESLLRLEFSLSRSTDLPAEVLWKLRNGRAAALSNLEALYNTADHWEQAVRAFSEFYEEARANGDADAAFLVQVHLARAQVAAGAPESAVATFSDALHALQRGAGLRPESVRFLYVSVFSVRPYWNADIRAFVFRFNRDLEAVRERREQALRDAAAAARRDKDKTREMQAVFELGLDTAPAEAESYFRRALALAQSLKRRDIETACWERLGYLVSGRQDYAAADADLERALTLALWGDGRTLGEMDPAYHAVDSAVELKQGDPAVVARLLRGIGEAQLGLGSPLTALAFIKRSLAVQPDARQRLLTIDQFSKRLDAAGFDAPAVEFLEKLLADPSVDQDPRLKAQVLIGLADVQRKTGGLGQDWALERLETAYALIKPRGLRDDDVPLLVDLGLLRLQKGEVPAAVEAYQSALNLLEAYRAGLESENARVAFLSNDVNRSSYYQIAVGGLLAAARRDPAFLEAAFAATEKMHARVLLEALSGADVEAAGPLRAQETALAQRISLLVQKGRDGGWGVEDALKFDALQDQLARLADQMRREDPRYAALRYPKSPTLKDLQKVLKPGEALVSYKEGIGGAAWAFVVRSSGTPRLLPIDASTLSAAARPSDPQKAKEKQDWHPIFQALGAALWSPIEGDLNGVSKVFVVPDGGLWIVPWSVLETTRGALVDQDYALQIVPSAGVLMELRGQKAAVPPPGDLIAFAPFAVPESQEKAAAAQAKKLHQDHPLPGSWDTLAKLKGLFTHEALYLPPDATRDRAIQESGDYRTVLYYAHGLADESDPWLSSLAFKDKDGKEELLTVTDVMRLMKLDRTDLVILSACESARGQLVRGEGVMGLARGFFYAGARGVLATDWSVADKPTSDLVVDFMNGLKRGLAPARALQEAQRGVRKRSYYGVSGAAPFFWGAFQLYGDP